MSGLDEELGLGQEEEAKELPKVVEFEKPKRKPFHYWKVGDREIKLKLKAGMIVKVEEKLRKNVLDVLAGGTPRLDEMLLVIQAAAAPWQHKMSYNDVQKLYDTWIQEDGGDLTLFIKSVLMPTLVVSGFFPLDQEAEILESLEDVE